MLSRERVIEVIFSSEEWGRKLGAMALYKSDPALWDEVLAIYHTINPDLDYAPLLALEDQLSAHFRGVVTA